MKRGTDIGDLIKPLASCNAQVILTNKLQVADILEWILRQTGKADIFQTTFSVAEEFLRRLFFMRREGLVRNASLIIDNKASNKTVKLWIFISRVYEKTFMTDNHSKILLVQAINGMRVAVITSQNLTRGNRFESTLITTDADIFDNLRDEFRYISEFKSDPLDELLR